MNLNDSEYEKSVLQRMNYTRRKGTTSKVALLDGICDHHQIVGKNERYDIPDSIILSFDQTPSKYVPVASTILAKQNSKQVCLEGFDDKRSITATFTITMDRKFLGMQLIYGSKTNQSLPRSQFAKDFLLSVNPKHYSNEKESLKVIDETVLPYVTEARQRLVKPNQKALAIFVVFKGQITDEVLSQYKNSNIEVVFVPASMTDLLTTKEGKDIIMSGWKSAGISQVIRTGSANLVSLDPFSDIDQRYYFQQYYF